MVYLWYIQCKAEVLYRTSDDLRGARGARSESTSFKTKRPRPEARNRSEDRDAGTKVSFFLIFFNFCFFYDVIIILGAKLLVSSATVLVYKY